MQKFLRVTLLVVSLLSSLKLIDLASCETSFYSHEVESNKLIDGDTVITEIKEVNVNPEQASQSEVRHNIIMDKVNSNNIVPLNQADRFERFTGKFSKFAGFLTRPRTVESPALSVDTGGGGVGSSTIIAGEISKLFNVKQGYYSDIYNRIDGRVPLSTRRPAEVIEDTMRRAVENLFRRDGRHYDRHSNHSPNDHRN